MTKLAEIQQAIGKLPEADRVLLWHWFRENEAEALEGPDPANEEAWKSEVGRRVAEIERGQVEGIPGEVVMAKLRKIVGR